MNSYSHVKIMVVDLCPYLFDNFQHIETHLDYIESLLHWVSLHVVCYSDLR
jgi:hypothetical protein